MNIEETTFPATTVLGIKQTVSIDTIKDPKFYEENFGNIFAFSGLQAIELVGQPMTIYFEWNKDKNEVTLAPALPISDDIAKVDTNVDSIEVIKIDESDAIKAEHWGDYAQLGETHERLSAYCEEKNLVCDKPCIEQYVTDPGEESDQSKWLTNVYYLIN